MPPLSIPNFPPPNPINLSMDKSAVRTSSCPNCQEEDQEKRDTDSNQSSICNGCYNLEKPTTKIKQLVWHITLPCTTSEKSDTCPHGANSTRDTEAPQLPPEEGIPKKQKRSKLRKYRGFAFAIVSSFCFSVTALIVKILKDYNSVNLALWRFQGAFLPALPIMVFHHFSHQNKKAEMAGDDFKGKVSTKRRRMGQLKIVGLLILRSIFTCNALLLHFYSLKYLAVGDALVLLASTPVFAYIVAYFLLREPCGIVPIATSILTILGVVFIIRPPTLTGQGSFDYNTLIGTGLGLGATILATISYCLLRFSRSAHFGLTTFFFGAWGTVECVIVAVALGVFSLPHGARDWLLGGVLAFLTFFGQIAIILALKYEKAGPVTLIRTVDVLFGFLWQILFWQKVPDLYSLVGAAIVVSGVIVIGIRKWVGSLAEDDTLRLRMSFILK